jgi:hypothetical protein
MMYGLYFPHIDINIRCDEVLLTVLCIVQCIILMYFMFEVLLCVCIWSSLMFSITVHHLRECVVNWCKWRTAVYNVVF